MNNYKNFFKYNKYEKNILDEDEFKTFINKTNNEKCIDQFKSIKNKIKLVYPLILKALENSENIKNCIKHLIVRDHIIPLESAFSENGIPVKCKLKVIDSIKKIFLLRKNIFNEDFYLLINIKFNIEEYLFNNQTTNIISSEILDDINTFSFILNSLYNSFKAIENIYLNDNKYKEMIISLLENLKILRNTIKCLSKLIELFIYPLSDRSFLEKDIEIDRNNTNINNLNNFIQNYIKEVNENKIISSNESYNIKFKELLMKINNDIKKDLNFIQYQLLNIKEQIINAVEKIINEDINPFVRGTVLLFLRNKYYNNKITNDKMKYYYVKNRNNNNELKIIAERNYTKESYIKFQKILISTIMKVDFNKLKSIIKFDKINKNLTNEDYKLHIITTKNNEIQQNEDDDTLGNIYFNSIYWSYIE